MGIRKRKPTSAGRRFQTSSDFSEITSTTPEKSLLTSKPRLVDVTRMVARPHVTAVAATNSSTE